MLGAFAVHVPCYIFITIIFDTIQYAHEFSKYYPLMNVALRSSIQSIFDSPRCCSILLSVFGDQTNIGDYPLQG
jgi:hypothetical protein